MRAWRRRLAQPRANVSARPRTLTTLVAIFTAILTAGLLVPFALGEHIDAPTTGSGASGDTFNAADGDPSGADLGEPSKGSQALSPAADTGATADLDGGTTDADASTADTQRSPSSGSASAAASPAPAELSATDVGVTADSIKIGVLILDVSSLNRVGVAIAGIDAEQQRAAYDAFFGELNDAGGINGRRIEPVYRNFDVFSPDDQRAACLYLTKDARVFAVLAPGGYQDAALLCVAHENATPLIAAGTTGMPTAYIHRAAGRLFSIFQDTNPQMASFVAKLHEFGLLRRQKIGVVGDESDAGRLAIDEGLLPALRRAGYAVTHRSRLSGDTSAASSQIPVEVQAMRTAGVTTVLLVTDTLKSTQFVQTADGQAYRPRYLVSDFAGMWADVSAQNMPDSYEGTVGITVTRNADLRAGRPETPRMTECRAVYETRVRRRLEPRARTDEYGITMQMCDLVAILDTGIRAAGPNLTRIAFITALEHAGQIPSAFTGGGSFRADKHGFGDFVRPIRWEANCKCYAPAGGFTTG